MEGGGSVQCMMMMMMMTIKEQTTMMMTMVNPVAVKRCWFLCWVVAGDHALVRKILETGETSVTAPDSAEDTVEFLVFDVHPPVARDLHEAASSAIVVAELANYTTL